MVVLFPLRMILSSSSSKSFSRLSWYLLLSSYSLVLPTRSRFSSSASFVSSSQAPNNNNCPSQGASPLVPQHQQHQHQLHHCTMASTTTPLNDGTMNDPLHKQQQLASAAASRCILPLTPDSHKGSSGRIAVLGGSAHFTGAPYYAALSALKVGADLAYVFTAAEAATAIKCYSPELMVLPIYSATEFDEIIKIVQKKNSSSDYDISGSDDSSDDAVVFDNNKARADAAAQTLVDAVVPWLDRLHCLVIGPGLGRCPLVMQAVAQVIEIAKQQNLCLVLDADALYLLTQPPYRNLLQGYDRVVLTPNAVEYQRLVDNQVALDSVTLIRKGRVDVISSNKSNSNKNHENNSNNDSAMILECHEPGGWKRSGGIGDVLSGTVGTLLAWQGIMKRDHDDWPLACWTACCIVRRATRLAFEQKRRSMTAPDVLNELGSAVNSMTEED